MRKKQKKNEYRKKVKNNLIRTETSETVELLKEYNSKEKFRQYTIQIEEEKQKEILMKEVEKSRRSNPVGNEKMDG